MTLVCQRSSNHKLKAIHNPNVQRVKRGNGVSKIVKSQIESNSQHQVWKKHPPVRCVKDRQITNWKQFTTYSANSCFVTSVCQRSSNHKLKAIHNSVTDVINEFHGVSKIVKSQIESNSQLSFVNPAEIIRCVKDRQITNWKQFTTNEEKNVVCRAVCQRSSNHKLKAIHNMQDCQLAVSEGVSKIVKSQIESNSQHDVKTDENMHRCVKDRQITNWKQFTTLTNKHKTFHPVCQRSSNHKLKAIHNYDLIWKVI